MTDDRLAHLLTIVPPRSLLLLEDIDAAFGSRQEQRNQHEKDNVPPAYQRYHFLSLIVAHGLVC